MNRLSIVACLTLVAVMASQAGAQPFHLDPCRVATFPDVAKRDEYRSWQAKLNYSPQHRAAVRERTELSSRLWSRTAGSALRSRFNDAYRQVQEAVLDPELAEVQAVLMDTCFERLRQSPGTETEQVRADVQFLRMLLALPDGELEVRFNAHVKAWLDAYGTPASANQTLRIHAGLPVPH